MKVSRMVVLIGMMLISTLATSAMAGVTFDRFRFDGGYKGQAQYFGDDRRGVPGIQKYGIYADAQHRRLFALNISTTDFSGVPVSDMGKDRLSFALGVKAPFSSAFSLRFVYNHTVEQGSNESLDLFGLFPEFKLRFLSPATLGFGYEQNAAQLPDLITSTLRNDWTDRFTSFAGVSINTPFRDTGSTDAMLIGGTIVKLNRLWFLSGAGLHALDGKVPYTLGVAWPSRFTAEGRFDTVGLNPGAIIVYRKKLHSEYALAVLALKARGVNSHVADGVLASTGTGLLNPTRVLNNKNFDMGVGSGYKEYEFGTSVFTATYVRTDITEEVELIQYEAGLYQVFPGSIGPITKSYAGAIISSSSEVRFDFRHYRLVSDSHATAQLLLGTYWPVGKSRLDLSLSAFFWERLEGAGVQCSIVL